MPKSKVRKKPIISDKEIQELKIQTITLITYASILSFADSYKTKTSKRTMEFSEKLKKQLIAIRNEHVNIRDYEEVLKDEYGIDTRKIFEL